MKYKLSALLITAAALLWAAGASAAIGDTAGSCYSTDIVTYIYNAPITSYNIGGRTVIEAESLNWHFGFDVYWRPESRRLDIYDKGGSFNSLEALNGSLCKACEGAVGTPAGSFYVTDIVAAVDGREIESYNIGGVTCIVVEELRNFGYDVVWDGEARTLTVTKPDDFYKIETDYGIIGTDNNYSLQTSFGTWTEGISFSDGSESVTAPVICTASSEIFIKLSDLCRLFGAECTMTAEKRASHTEWGSGIGYDDDYNVYNFIISFDAPKYSSYDLHTGGEFELRSCSAYEINDIVYATVNAVPVSFVSTYPSRYGGIKAYNTGIYVVDSEIYIPAYLASLFTGGEYKQPE